MPRGEVFLTGTLGIIKTTGDAFQSPSSGEIFLTIARGSGVRGRRHVSVAFKRRGLPDWRSGVFYSRQSARILIYRKFKNPETMALAFSESGHNLKEARLWQECGYASGAFAQVKQVGFRLWKTNNPPRWCRVSTLGFINLQRPSCLLAEGGQSAPFGCQQSRSRDPDRTSPG